MSVQEQARIGGVLALAAILALLLARSRLGRLHAASWLVVLGAGVIAGEHAQFATSYSVPFITTKGPMRLLPHARLHFFMAGIYTLIGLVLLRVLARTLLKEGRRSGWYALLFALLVGGGFDLVMGGWWFPHGSPLYQVFGEPVQGFGWESLYAYPVAWIAGLVLSYQPIFRAKPSEASPLQP